LKIYKNPNLVGEIQQNNLTQNSHQNMNSQGISNQNLMINAGNNLMNAPLSQ